MVRGTPQCREETDLGWARHIGDSCSEFTRVHDSSKSRATIHFAGRPFKLIFLNTLFATTQHESSRPARKCLSFFTVTPPSGFVTASTTTLIHLRSKGIPITSDRWIGSPLAHRCVSVVGKAVAKSAKWIGRSEVDISVHTKRIQSLMVGTNGLYPSRRGRAPTSTTGTPTRTDTAARRRRTVSCRKRGRSKSLHSLVPTITTMHLAPTCIQAFASFISCVR